MLPQEPFLFKPIFKDKLWGGQNFRSKLNKEIPASVAVGESWEISGYGDDQSVIVNGEMAGKTIGYLFENFHNDLCGPIPSTSSFPLLYKFIDAMDNLSVQVHPGDQDAQANGWGEFGKTECWYVVDAQEDAEIVVGFNTETTPAEIKNAISDGSLKGLLNRFKIAAGDVLYIPAGTVHAIMEGTLIYEVQETSDTTLRLYDWDRVDDNGNPRDLHVADALKIIDTTSHNRHRIEPVTIELKNGIKHSFRVACTYFSIEQFTYMRDTSMVLPQKKSFRVITVIGKPITLSYEQGTIEIPQGQTALIPAHLKDVKAHGVAGSRFLLSTVPDLQHEIINPLLEMGVSKDAIALLGGYWAKNDLMPLL